MHKTSTSKLEIGNANWQQSDLIAKGNERTAATTTGEGDARGLCEATSLIRFYIIAVGYTSADVLYKWKNPTKAVEIAVDMKLSQFDLVKCPGANMTDRVGHSRTDRNSDEPISYVCKFFFFFFLRGRRIIMWSSWKIC